MNYLKEVPQGVAREWQHCLDTYVSETNKTASIWLSFEAKDWDFKPHVKSSSVVEIFRHQLLSERRFFGEFMGTPEVSPKDVLVEHGFAERLVELARPRLDFLARQERDWWLQRVKFFDVERERVWVFWRRVLHTSHHRTQLTVYQRLLEQPVLSTYGPTADVTWERADPTNTVEAAGRD